MGFIHDRIAASGHQVDYLHAEDVAIRSPGARRFTFPIAVYRKAAQAHQEGRPYDLLNIHEPSAVRALVGRGRIGRPKVVVTSHGVERREWELALEEARLGRGGPSLKTRIVYPWSRLWQSRYGLTHADHVFCLNDEDRAFLSQSFHIDGARVTRIFPAADPIYRDLAGDRDYTRARTILFAATWRKNKGIQDLIPAFVELLGRHPATELLVLGAGVPPDTVKSAFPEAARHAVTCISTSSEQDTARAFASADLFVLPSLFEGTPLTLLEAMASGLPIVTTDVCGMKDVIDHDRNGLLVPIRTPHAIAEALGRLLDDSALRQRIGTAARDDARGRYSWDRSAALVARVYAHLTGHDITVAGAA